MERAQSPLDWFGRALYGTTHLKIRLCNPEHQRHERTIDRLIFRQFERITTCNGERAIHKLAPRLIGVQYVRGPTHQRGTNII